MAGITLVSAAAAATLSSAIVVGDPVALRAAPRDSAPQHALLRQGELVEVRGERMDYLQVYDHQRERAGFIRSAELRRVAVSASDAPELLTLLRFVKDRPGQEALTLGLAALWFKAAPAPAVQGAPGVEALEALGLAAERLAQRASAAPGTLSKAGEATLSAHLEVAGRYGVRFNSYQHEGRIQVCYDGEAFRRVLALESEPVQRARAALALTRAECVEPDATPQALLALNLWRAEVLERVQAQALPPYLKNRIHLRRASAWAALAYQRTRLGAPQAPEQARSAAARSLQELALVVKAELPDEDLPAHNDAAMRVNASRWALWPTQVAAAAPPTSATGAAPALRLRMLPGKPGETCIQLHDARRAATEPVFSRCTYAVVWPQSASFNREGTAAVLAVQPMEGWRELWLLRRQGEQWALSIVPPAALTPHLGYAEFAGWAPGGAQMLLAREARGEGRYQRQFAVLNLDTLAVARQANDPGDLGPFQRWQDAAWKRDSVSVR